MSPELQAKMQRRRRLSDASADSRLARAAARRTEETLQRGREATREAADSKPTPELQRKLSKQLMKEKVSEYAGAGLDLHDGDRTRKIVKATVVDKSDKERGASGLSPELALKLRRRRVSMGEEEMREMAEAEAKNAKQRHQQQKEKEMEKHFERGDESAVAQDAATGPAAAEAQAAANVKAGQLQQGIATGVLHGIGLFLVFLLVFYLLSEFVLAWIYLRRYLLPGR